MPEVQSSMEGPMHCIHALTDGAKTVVVLQDVQVAVDGDIAPDVVQRG